MSEKIHISLLLSVVSYILIVSFLYQNTEKMNKFTLVRVNTDVGNKLGTLDEQENTCIKSKKQYHRNNPAIQWLKYGEEKSDWALLIYNRLCVEKDDGDKKKLVIYSSEKLNTREVPGRFNVTFTEGNPFVMHGIEKNRTVYFITVRGKDRVEHPNLHHFMGDFAATLNAIQTLIHCGEKQSVFFQYPTDSSDHFLLPLYEAIGLRYIDQYFSYDYNQVPAGTCFQRSVIADADHVPWRRSASERRHHHYYTEMLPLTQRIKSHFNISNIECNNKKYPRITILNRNSSRRILNVNVLLHALLERGYENTQIRLLENMTMEDQLKLIHCTDVLIGVQGAGLQWASFLRKNASLVEIAWPTRGWHFFYADPDFALEFFADIRLFQVEVRAEDVIFPEHYGYEKGVLRFPDAQKGEPIVPVYPFVNTIRQAAYGAPSNTPWKRFEVGEFERRLSRLPK